MPWRAEGRRVLYIRAASLGASDDSLAGPGCGELADGALHTIARTIALLGGDRVVVRRPWLEALDAHAERRVLMSLVQPDGIFRRLAQVLRIGAVLHDAVMHIRPPGVVGRPPDDGQVIGRRLELGPFGDLDALGFLGRRKYLRGSRLEREQAADRGRDRECQKQCIHGWSRSWRTRHGWSVSRPPSSVLPLRNWHSGERRDAADSRCTLRKRRRGDN